MKKTTPESTDPADREIDFSGGVRGKYVERDRAPGITVHIEPDVAQVGRKSGEAIPDIPR